MHNRSGPVGFLLMMLVAVCALAGCKSASLTEIVGKTQFGPQFENLGNNTHQTKYYTIQTVEFKLANKWTLGVMYQRTDMNEGSGDNENLVLFEVGYPLWNAPKKPEKTAIEQIEDLEKELRALDSELAAVGEYGQDSTATAFVPSKDIDDPMGKEKGE